MGVKRFYVIFCLFSLALGPHLYAKPYFRHFGAQEGLLSPNVLSVCQDSLGRIWFGTENGACYYDGDMHIVQGVGEVSRLLCDAKGVVWYLSEGSLYRCLASQTEPQAVLPGEADAFCLANGVLHVASGYQDLYWNVETQSLSPHRQLPFDNVRGICVDTRGNTWITCPQGLVFCPPLQNKHYSIISTIGDLGTLFEASDGRIWVGSLRSGALCVQNDGSIIRYTVDTHGDKGFPSDNIRSFAESSSGIIWMGTFRGLCRFEPSSGQFSVFRREEREGGLNSSSIHSLLKDRDNLLWAGTYYGGVHFFDTRPGAMSFYPESPDEGLSHSVVGHLAKAGNNGVWICTEGGGLNRLEGERIVRFDAQPFTNVKWVDICPERNCMWIATQPTGLYRMDLGRKQFYKVTPTSASSPLSVVNMVLHHGKELFLSTEDGVYVHSLEHHTDSLLYPQTGGARYVHEMIVGNELWLASSEIVVFDLETKQLRAQYPVWDGETSARPMRLLATREGRIYASTFGHGLYRLQDGRFVPFVDRDVQLNANGYQLVEAPGGQLLVSGEKGIQLLDRHGGHIRSWLPGQDLPLESLVRDSGLLLTADGTVYAGGTNGLVSFRLSPESGKDVEDIYFSELFVDGTPMSFPSADKLVLTGKQNQIVLGFSSRHYVTELNWANYQYRVKGLDNDWKDLSGRHLQVEQVLPGSYFFELRRRSRPEVMCSLQIVIKAPWYNSTAAFILYALLLLFILWMIFRNIHLHRESKRIQELNETKLRFFTTVSHELRSPLTLIIAQIESIFRTFHLPPQVTHKMDKIMSQAEQMNQLVTELIDFRKFEQGLITLHLSPTYVNMFVGDILEKFREIASGKDIELGMVPDSSNPMVYMDGFHLQKVLMNLIFNAVKYTPAGGKIQLAVESDEKQVHIHVRDTGIGIAPEEQDKVFERFYQSAQPADTVTQGIPGSGIGLALAKDIAKKHHGNISVQSEPGKGSDFTLTLPKGTVAFADDKQIVIAPEPHPVEDFGNERPIAVVAEDNSQMREILRELFEIQYRVLCATDGKEALELVRHARPDLVVSDVMMPRLSGIELCSAIKNTEELRHIPVVLLTALDQTEQQIGSLLKGADDYIAKPFNSRLLLARCNNLVRSHRREQTVPTVAESELSLKATSEEDQAFLDKLGAIIEENIDNPDLNNNLLASLMNMSRSSFYDRFRRITSETPNSYITTYRLKKASILLRQEPNKSIAEIAETLGFNTQNYFCRRFKEHFGVSPSQYRTI